MSIFGPMNVLDRVDSFLGEQVRGVNSNIVSALGIPANRKFVCLSIRDGSYYASTGMKESAGYELVNFDAQLFIEACQFLISEGFYVIRVGTPTSNTLGGVDGVIDYANSSLRTEANDLVLIRECAFMVSTQTGPDSLALALRKPVLYIDTLIFRQFFFGTRLATWNPVKFVPQDATLPMTLAQLLDSPLTRTKSLDDFLSSGFSFQRSSGADISHMVASFVQDRRGEMSIDEIRVRKEVNLRLTNAFGERGQQLWGDVAAQLNGWWIRQNGEWFLS
jgi:putative glycosyltransferase (TIGR04372 family)